jgi:CRP-like cAMP-binding protein
MTNAFYRELISNSAEDDFEKKLNALMESTIFRETSKMMVTPLMSTLEKQNLAVGKVLLRQDEEVHRLYFVADGNLKIIYIDRAKRSVKHLNIE